MELTACPAGPPTLDLQPAPVRRAWMDATPERFANRCLPMLIASQSGWVLTSRHAVTAIWDGGAHPASTKVTVAGCDGWPPAISHFGAGVVTWTVPFLFRTPPGWNLLARGPANEPLDGATALEGLVETDWSDATFTMNWQLTRPLWPVTWPAGFPVCMLVPHKRGDLEEFTPAICATQPDGFAQWSAERRAFLDGLAAGDPGTVKQKWQRDYFRSDHPGHQMKRALRPFTPEA